MRKYFTAAAALASLAALAPGAASAQSYDAQRIVTSITQADLVALVRARGDQVVEENAYGDVSVMARDAVDGIIYHLIGKACGQADVTGCLGLDIQVRYDDDSSVTLAKINEANIAYAVAKASYDLGEDDKLLVYITHYMILDGGQRLENIDTTLLNVLGVAPLMANVIWPE
jgi:hypothetical protein